MMVLLRDWSFEPAVMLGIALVALLYGRGIRYSVRHGIARHVTRVRVVSFAAGLLAVVVALESPIDAWSDRYLWVHMLQHEILTMVAAPLLVLGSPALPVFRAIPLGARRRALRWGTQQARLHSLWWRVGRPLGSPAGAWVLFVGDFAFWHIPPLYDLTLERPPVHYLEHSLFLGTAILFWAQALPSPPTAAPTECARCPDHPIGRHPDVLAASRGCRASGRSEGTPDRPARTAPPSRPLRLACLR